MTATIPELSSTSQAAEAADVSFRMVDYWVRHGVIRPALPSQGSGHPRRWSTEDVYVLGVLGQVASALNGQGCQSSAELLGRVADEAREHYRRVGSAGRPLHLSLGTGVGLVIDPQVQS